MNNTLNRRMFMQQGGVVPSQTMLPPAQTMAPQMMAPPAQTMLPPAQMEAPPAQVMDPQMMAPPPQMMDPSMPPPGATQQVAGELMEQEGAALTDGIMSQVDSAQDYEELMNAIRGNELPIESRRGELAEYVGTPDAEQTPDSVLTLVQPTLSIVDAQGGLDSLMQEQADVVMEDGTGAPTQMAGGLGSMLMAGQPEEPVQMAVGGVVPGDPTENPYITQMRELDPVFQELMGDTEGRRKAALGQTQLNFAGDILSSLYTPTAAPVGFLGRLAPAAGAFAKNVGALGATEQERADKMRAAQLGMAGQEVQSIREQAIASAAAKARIKADLLRANALLDAQKLTDIREDDSAEARITADLLRANALLDAQKLTDTREDSAAERLRDATLTAQNLADIREDAAAERLDEVGRTHKERQSSTLRNAELAREYAAGGSGGSDSGQMARKWEQAFQSRLTPIQRQLPDGNFVWDPPPPLSRFEMDPVIQRYDGNYELLPPYLKNNANFLEAFKAAARELKERPTSTFWWEEKSPVNEMADGGLVRKVADGDGFDLEAIAETLAKQDAEAADLEERKQTLSYWLEENPEALNTESENYTSVPLNVLTQYAYDTEYGKNAPFDTSGVASNPVSRFVGKPLTSAWEFAFVEDPATLYEDDERMMGHIRSLSALLKLRLPETVRSGSEGGDRQGQSTNLIEEFDDRLLGMWHKTPSEVGRIIQTEFLPPLEEQYNSIKALQSGTIPSTQGAEKLNAITALVAKFGAAAKFFQEEGRGSEVRKKEVLQREWFNRVPVEGGGDE